MDCDTILDRLEDFLEGRLGTDECRAVREHVRRCARCRDLAAWVGEPGAAQVAPPPELAAAILAGTSGAPCASARPRIVDLVDGGLGPLDTELVLQHLSSCESCTTVRRVLDRMAADLTELATLAPDERFVRDVLAATSLREEPEERAARRLARTAPAWQRLLLRPRLAWEGAYVGTLVLALVFGVPGSPLARVPRRALELARTNPVAQLEQPVAGLGAELSAGARSTWRDHGEPLLDALRTAGLDLARRSAAGLERIDHAAGTLRSRPASGQENTESDRPPSDGEGGHGDER